MKLFSPEKANALIPVLEPLIEEMWRKRQELAILLLEGDPAISAGHAKQTRLIAKLKSEVIRLVHRVESHGCVVKDLDLGLLDFPALREGRPILLCWKPGEAAIAHWHGTDEGFAQRKPL
jgi:hypothetical protein